MQPILLYSVTSSFMCMTVCICLDLQEGGSGGGTCAIMFDWLKASIIPVTKYVCMCSPWIYGVRVELMLAGTLGSKVFQFVSYLSILLGQLCQGRGLRT